MLHNLRTRSKSVASSVALRRMLLHADILQDETANMNQATTIVCLLFNLYIQIVPVNNTSDTAMNMILGSAKWIPAIFVAGLAITLLIVSMLVISVVLENKYLASGRNHLLTPPEHVKTLWYKFYKHLFRLHFLLLEPILSGYSISLLLPTSAFNSYHIFPQVCGILGGGLGLILSILYLVTVESIIPSASFTSSTSRVNIGLISMGLRLCMFLDYNYTYASSKALIFSLLLVRLLPSVVAFYYDLFRTHFFFKYGRLFFVGFHASNIIYSLIFFIMGNNSTSVTIIPACLLVMLGIRVVYNLDTREYTNLNSLSANKLTDILDLETHLYSANNDSSLTASVGALRFRAIMSHLSSEKNSNLKEHIEKFASANEIANDPEQNPLIFILYLYERAWQRSGKRDFMILVYETLWSVTMRMNLFHIAVLLSRVEHLDLNFIEQCTQRALIRHIEHCTNEIYQEKQSLIPVNEQFYQSQSVAEQNAVVARDHNVNSQDDESNGNWDMGKTNVTTKIYKTNLQNFDVYNSMKNIERYQKLLDKMQETISTLLRFYDNLNKRVIEIENVHETMKKIRGLKQSVNSLFRNLETGSGEQSQYHLLPYAVFLESINNDRQASQKILKIYDHRCQLLERSRYMTSARGGSAKFDLSRMLCIGVDCTRTTLGRMSYISENCEEVLGQPAQHYEGRTISCLLTDEFQPLHEELLNSFVKDQDKPYIGVSRERLVRVKDHIYTKCEVLVRLSPVLDSRSLSFMCLLRKNTTDQEFMVVNHQGIIIGRSQGLDWTDFVVGKSFTTIEAKLADRAGDKIRTMLLKNSAILLKALSVPSSNQPMHISEPSKTQQRRQSISAASVGKSHLENLDSEQKDEAETSKRLRIKAVRFAYHGKSIFTDLVLTFPNQLGDRPGDSQNDSARDFQLTSSGNSRLKKPDFKSSLAVATPPQMLLKAKDPKKAFKKTVLNFGEYEKVNFADGGLNVESVRKSSMISTIAKSEATMIKALPEEPSELMIPSQMELPLEYVKNRQAESPRLDRAVERNQAQADYDLQSSLKSSVMTGSMYTSNIKARVLSTIRHQRRYMAWKELIGIVLLQILIWTCCIYIQNLLNNSFGTQLGDLIRLRSGFGKMLVLSSASFSAGIQTIERMLNLRKRMPDNKFVIILPTVQRSISGTTLVNINTMQNFSVQLAAHIYNFEEELSQRYLKETYDYTYTYYGEQNTTTSLNMTKTLNLLDHARECIYTIRRWNAGVDKFTTGFYFSNKLVSEYYQLMTAGWTAVNYNTIDSILDQDTESYQAVVAEVKVFVQANIVICLVLAAFMVLLLWTLRKKMVTQYSIIENLLPFEVLLMQDRLRKVQETLNKQKYSEDRTKSKMSRLVRGFDLSYHMCRQRNDNSRSMVRNRVSFFSWLGVGWVTMLSCIIVIGYQLVEYITVDDLGSKLGRLLFLQEKQRTLLTTTNIMSAIHFNTYIMTVKAAGYGTNNLASQEEFSATLAKYGHIFEDNVSQLDNFITHLPLDHDEILNFKDVLFGKPCDYLNYSSYGLPRSECESLAGYTMNKSIIEAYRWVRMEMPAIIVNFQQATNKSDPVANLLTKEFLIFAFTRRNLFSEFTDRFTTKFFELLTVFHQAKFVRPLDSILLVGVLLCGVLSLIVICIAIWKTVQNIEAGLQVFLLVPPESYYHNPHIAAKLLTITR